MEFLKESQTTVTGVIVQAFKSIILIELGADLVDQVTSRVITGRVVTTGIGRNIPVNRFTNRNILIGVRPEVQMEVVFGWNRLKPASGWRAACGT